MLVDIDIIMRVFMKKLLDLISLSGHSYVLL